MNNLFGGPEFQYRPPGIYGYDQNFEQRPLTKIEKHAFDATSKTDDWMAFKAGFRALVGDRLMPDSQKLYMLLDMLDGEPKKIAKRLAGDEYDTESYITTWNALEENYGGLARARKSVHKRLAAFPKMTKFTVDNTLEFSAMIASILRQFSTSAGIMDECGVLNESVKEICPKHELENYYMKVAEYRATDSLRLFYEWVETRRVALKLASISSDKDSTKTYFSETEKPFLETIVEVPSRQS